MKSSALHVSPTERCENFLFDGGRFLRIGSRRIIDNAHEDGLAEDVPWWKAIMLVQCLVAASWIPCMGEKPKANSTYH